MGGNSCSKPKNQVAVAPRDSKHGGGSSSSNRSNRRPFPERTEEEDTPSYLYGHSHVTKVAPSPSRARNEREDDDDRELTVTSDSTAGNGGAFTRDNSFGQQQHSGFTSRSISSPKNNNATRTDGCPTANIFDQGNADAEFTYRGGLKGLKLKPEVNKTNGQVSASSEGSSSDSEKNSESDAKSTRSTSSGSSEDLVCLDWLESDTENDENTITASSLYTKASDSFFQRENAMKGLRMTKEDDNASLPSRDDEGEEVVDDFLEEEDFEEEQNDASPDMAEEGSNQGSNQESSNSEQAYHSQFKEFDEEWQSLETLNLVLERAQIPKDQQEKFLTSLEQEEFSPGDYIVKEGDMGDKFYVVTEGEVIVTKNNVKPNRRQSIVERITSSLGRKKKTSETTITHLYQGHFFGETSLVKEEPRNANVKVPTNGNKVVCMSMTKDVFKPLMEQEANFRKMIRELMMKKEEVRSRRQSVSISQLHDQAKKEQQVTENDARICRLLRRVKTSDGRLVINNYLLNKLLGKGSYGTVWLAQHLGTGKLCAVKIISRLVLRKKQLNKRSNAQVLREFAVMKKLSHPNLVKLHEVIDDPEGDLFYMIQEYLELGPVMTEHEYNQPLEISVARKYFRQLLQAAHYLHFQGVAHRDIKPSNVLVSSTGNCKLADFGASVITKDGMAELNDVKGTPAFQPPEVFTTDTGAKYDAVAVDMWAIGATLHCMVVGIPPYMANNEFELVEKLKNEPFRLATNIQLDPHLKNLLLRLLDKDPTRRVSLEDVLRHDWVTEEGSMPLVMPDYKRLDLANNLETIEKDIEKKQKQHARRAARASVHRPVESPTRKNSEKSIDSNYSGSYVSFYSEENVSKDRKRSGSWHERRARSESVGTEVPFSHSNSKIKEPPNVAPNEKSEGDLTELDKTHSNVKGLPPQSPTLPSKYRVDLYDDANSSPRSFTGLNVDSSSSTSLPKLTRKPSDSYREERKQERHEEKRSFRRIESGSSVPNAASPFGISKGSLRATSSAYHMMRASSLRHINRVDKKSNQTKERDAAKAHLNKLRSREEFLLHHQDSKHATDILEQQVKGTSYPVRTQEIIEEILFDASGSVIDPLDTSNLSECPSHDNLRSCTSRPDENQHRKCFSEYPLKNGTESTDRSLETTSSSFLSGSGSESTTKKEDGTLTTVVETSDEAKGKTNNQNLDMITPSTLSSVETDSPCNHNQKTRQKNSLTRVGDFMMVPKRSHSGGTAKVVYRVEQGITRTHTLQPEEGNANSQSFFRLSTSPHKHSSSHGDTENGAVDAEVDSDGESSDSYDETDTEEVECVDDMEGNKIANNLETLLDNLHGQQDAQLEQLSEHESNTWQKIQKDLTGDFQERSDLIHQLISNDSPSKHLVTSSGGMTRSSKAEGTVSYQKALSPAQQEQRHKSLDSTTCGKSELLNIIYGMAAQQGHLPSMEDRAVIVPSVNQVSPKFSSSEEYPQSSYFAVFDGHSGERTSSTLANRLHKFIFEHEGVKEADPTSAIVDGCLDCDEEILSSAVTQEDISGSTALIVFITKQTREGPTYIYCGNVGDSRAILSRNGQVVELSVDHKASRADEQNRIEKAGGYVVNGRAQGVLAVSRAFGDVECKRAKDNSIRGDIITASPEVMHEIVHPEDDFVVMASDGLWDVMESEEVANYVKRRLSEHGDVGRATKELVDKAINSGSHDNVTVIIVALNQLESIKEARGKS